MFYSNERYHLRQQFYAAHQKSLQSETLTSVEYLIVETINQHPEYGYLFNDKEQYIDKDFLIEANETNPFLHMSAHLGLQEQISTNRPKGIAKIYSQLQKKNGLNNHQSEHLMMDCMMEAMWKAQREERAPDDNQYLKQLRRLIKR